VDPERVDLDDCTVASREADRDGGRSAVGSYLYLHRGPLAALRRRRSHPVLLGVDPERRDAAGPADAAASRIGLY
jgi:hypothetical protein